MSLETAQFIHQLNSSNPSGADRLKEGDDHIRLLKQTLKNTFPGITGPLDPSITPEFLKAIAGQLVPRGVISLYAGQVAPAGWWLCDGSEATLSDGSGTKFITPDLRGRAPVGADGVHALGSLWGQYAKTVTSEAGGSAAPTATLSGDGAHTHTVSDTALTAAQMPPHNHMNGVFDNTADTWVYGAAPIPFSRSSGPANNDSAATSQGFTSTDGGGAAHGHTLSGSGTHTHTVAVSAIAAHAHSVTIDTAQPSIAVNFIIKV